MASSAFKSTSKRSCDVSPPDSKTRGRNAPVRRTRSRSVVSRPDDDIQFSNKRDNPLFSSTHDESDESSRSNLNGRRFRSLSRNPNHRSKHEENETDQECGSKELPIQFNSMRNAFDSVENVKTWTSGHPIREPSDSLASVCSRSPVPNWDDGGSGVYFSEAEEQTINEFTQCILSVEDEDEASSRVCETGMDEKRRSLCDIPHYLVNGGTHSTTTNVNLSHSTRAPGPVELVLDIRREYVKELELSEERARQLRADLATEEHYGVELGRVLKELLPDSRVDSLQRRRIPKKNSSERRRMSKRLTDEALAYFDECISISTFDNSDPSSPEDPPLSLHASEPYSSKSIAQGCSTVRASCRDGSASSFYQESHGGDAQNQVSPSVTASNNGIAEAEPSSTFNSKSYHNTRESWSRVQENVRNVGTNKENEKHCCEAQTLNRQNDMEDYNLLGKAERLLLDKVLLKNRISSGSVAVCEGNAFHASSFIF